MTTEEKREYLREYNRRNKERISAQRKKYRQENKELVAQQKKEYAAKNKEKIRAAQAEKYRKNKDKYLAKMKQKYAENSEAIKAKRMEYYYKNKEQILAAQKESNKKNREKTRAQKAAYCKNRRAKDPRFLLIGRMRCRINDALRLKRFPKNGKTMDFVGCDIEKLVLHIESKFKNGMSWENRHMWHIDHIVPLALAKTKEELEALFHYKNLQPLWSSENMAKGSKILDS